MPLELISWTTVNQLPLKKRTGFYRLYFMIERPPHQIMILSFLFFGDSLQQGVSLNSWSSGDSQTAFISIVAANYMINDGISGCRIDKGSYCNSCCFIRFLTLRMTQEIGRRKEGKSKFYPQTRFALILCHIFFFTISWVSKQGRTILSISTLFYHL